MVLGTIIINDNDLPIDIAAKMIKATYKSILGTTISIFSDDELKEIADFLMVYATHKNE